ncbi:MAG: hypothetical protein AAGJ46_19485 [Planctomycetota bacterium]
MLVSLPAWLVLAFYGFTWLDWYESQRPRPANQVYIADFASLRDDPFLVALVVLSGIVISAVARAIFALYRRS